MNELDLDLEIAAATAKARKSLGRRLWENIAGDSDPSTQNFGERVGTLLNMGGEAMTMGLVGDETSAAVESLLPGVSYEDRKQHYRQQQLIAEDEAPFASLGAKIGGAVVLPFGAAKTLTQGALIGAGMGGTYGAMEAEGPLSERINQGVGGALVGGTLGAAAVPIGTAVSWAVKKGGRVLGGIFRQKKFFDGARITQEGRETLEALGFNADEVGAAFQREFQKGIDEGLAPPQAGNAARLAEFGIPAYRANVTGLADDFARMERGARGALGPAIEGQVRAAKSAQDVAMRTAADDIAAGLGGGIRGDQGDAAIMAISGVRKAYELARRTASDAYDALEASGGGLKGSLVTGMGKDMAQVMKMSGSRVDDLTPNAKSGLAFLDDAFKSAKAGSVPFMLVERARQRLVALRRAAYSGSLGADRIAMDDLLEAFDGRVNALMARAMTEGDPATIKLAENARGLWSEYAQRFKGKDATSRFLQDMIDDDASPDQVVRWLFSSGKLGTGRFNSTIAKGLKETLGEASDAWGMIRQSAFRQITQKPEGMAQMGPQAINQKLSEFLSSPATRELSRTLYSPQEIALFQRYAGALKKLVPPSGAVNYSGTAYEATRVARESFKNIIGLLGYSGGGVVGGATAIGANALAGKGKDWLTAATILGKSPAVTSAGKAATVGGVVGGQMGAPAGEFIRTVTGQPRQQ